MSDKTTVGLIGVGRMGVPMGLHWLQHGHALATYDPRPEAAESLVKQGATREATPAAVAAKSDIIFIIVGYPDQIESVMHGAGGILSTLRKDAVVIVTSTTSPRQVKRLAKLVRERGADLLDAPIARAEQAAHSATLLWFVGGSEGTLERVKPTMAECGPDIYHVGDVGSGQVGKGINNMLLWAAVVSNREALELADSFGVDENKLRTALLDSSAASWAMAHWDLMHTTPWAHKDMTLLIDMADDARLSLPLAALLRERVKDRWDERGIEFADHSHD